MNRKILIILIISAVALYAYIAFMIAGGSFSSSAKPENSVKNKDISIEKLALNTVPVLFKTSNRDPFSPYKKEPEKVAAAIVKQPIINVVRKDPPKPPSITITGIMWNPSNPIAMVKMPDGGSTVAKPGVVIDNITFRKIEQKRVQVSSEGKDFWIDRQ